MWVVITIIILDDNHPKYPKHRPFIMPDHGKTRQSGPEFTNIKG